MFADDTAIILRNQAEADAVIELLEIYSKATGAKVNLTKSYLLRISNLPTVYLLEIRVVLDKDLYKYLGIPVGIRNIQQLKRF